MSVDPQDPNLTVNPEGTVDQVSEGLSKVQEAIGTLTGQFADLLTKTTTMASDVAELKMKHAAAQVPAAVESTAGAAGQASGETIEGAANVAASPAATFVTRRRGFRRVSEERAK